MLKGVISSTSIADFTGTKQQFNDALTDGNFLYADDAAASYQPLDSDLTALAGNSTNGFWARTGAGTGEARTLTGTSSQIIVSDGNGVSGNPTFSLPQDVATSSAVQFGTLGVGGPNASTSIFTADLGSAAGTANMQNALQVGGTLTGTNSYNSIGRGVQGFYLTTTITSATNSNSIYLLPQMANSASASVTNMTSMQAYTGYGYHASATVGSARGIWLKSWGNTLPGTFTNQYGLYIENMTGATNNWAIYCLGGASYLNGNILQGTTTIPTGATFNHVLGGGASTPVLGAATADMVSTAAVDYAAGDRRFYIQGETGNAVSIGNGRIASSGSVGFQPNNLANGQSFNVDSLTELTTIAAAATTDTTIQLPANAVILAVTVRTTVVIPTATSYSVGDSGSATRFNTANVGVAANSTDPGTKAGAYFNATATSVRLTMNGGTPATNTGRVRVTIFYYTVTPPTS